MVYIQVDLGDRFVDGTRRVGVDSGFVYAKQHCQIRKALWGRGLKYVTYHPIVNQSRLVANQ